MARFYSMSSFHEVRFPVDIAYGSVGGPEYSTDVIVTHGGYEKRNINWEASRNRYNVAYGVQSQSQLDVLVAFFRARKGKAYGFRFKDWGDYQALNQQIGVGDGDEVNFQLVRNYESGVNSESRMISKPVENTVSVYIDDVLQASGWTLEANTGIITFDTAPDVAAIIKADFEFDVPVRFDTDRLSVTLEDYGTYSLSEVLLVELR